MKNFVNYFFAVSTALIMSACGGGAGGGPATDSINSSKSFLRSMEDLKDITQDDYSVHVVYAVPKGNFDESRDKNYQLQMSVFSANKWFSKISGGQNFNLDLRSNGDLDVTFWPMSMSNSELRLFDWQMRDEIERQLKKNSWYNKNKLYVVYFEGSHQRTCGDAPYWGEHVVVIYLKDAELNSAYNCSKNKFSTTIDGYGYWEQVFVHESIHVLGVIHTSDSNTDLMYAGSKAWDPKVVDFNNDEYYKHGVLGKFDIKNQLFLSPRLGNELPANWRLHD